MTADDTVCERLGHDTVTTYEDNETYTWLCSRCGAEGWGEWND